MGNNINKLSNNKVSKNDVKNIYDSEELIYYNNNIFELYDK